MVPIRYHHDNHLPEIPHSTTPFNLNSVGMAKKTRWTHKKRSRTIYPNGQDVFQGECILAEKIGEDGETLYLVKYEGYGLDEAKWVPESCAGPGLLADWAEEKDLLNSESVDGASTQDDEGGEDAERGDEENEDEEKDDSPSEIESLRSALFDVNEVDCVIAEHPTEYSHLLLRLPDLATGKRGNRSGLPTTLFQTISSKSGRRWGRHENSYFPKA